MNGKPVNSEHTDVGAYALGLLEPQDRQAFEEHLAGCPGSSRPSAYAPTSVCSLIGSPFMPTPRVPPGPPAAP